MVYFVMIFSAQNHIRSFDASVVLADGRQFHFHRGEHRGPAATERQLVPQRHQDRRIEPRVYGDGGGLVVAQGQSDRRR